MVEWVEDVDVSVSGEDKERERYEQSHVESLVDSRC